MKLFSTFNLCVNALLQQIADFFTQIVYKKGILPAYRFLYTTVYTPFYNLFPNTYKLYAKYCFVAIFVMLLIILVIIISSVKKNKKRKVTFILNGKKYKEITTKYKRQIDFPVFEDLEEAFNGWYVDKKLRKSFKGEILNKKKSIKLYGSLMPISDSASIDDLQVDNENQNEVIEQNENGVVTDSAQLNVNEAAIADNTNTNESEELKETTTSSGVGIEERISVQGSIVEEILPDVSTEMTLADFYDEIRAAMVGYERVGALSKMGISRKEIIAEMFEKNGKIYLYLSVDPSVMQEKGFNVERENDTQFAVVPCKKIIENAKDFEEALHLVSETMLVNNLQKSENVYVEKSQSDEKTRKNGFAFFVKNDVIATSANDYYRILRANVLSYTLSQSNKLSKNLDGKMILKIFKKDEDISIYCALDAQAEGLEFVGYDKNFAETPAKLSVKTAEDMVRAGNLIDKLMYRYSMEKHPENTANLSEEVPEKNCGFGYRIRF